jgi:N-carbamoyl-L-amino-acid hydrolase
LDGDAPIPDSAVISLTELNDLPTQRFVEQLGGIFEHSPWVAQRAAEARPFRSRLQLLDQMRAAVMAAPARDQLALIHAHPRLGVRGRSRQQLTDSSAAEQRHAGLDACSVDELALLERLNAAYEAKFQFPFILAVRGHDPQSIIANVERRLSRAFLDEQHAALTQIGLIAGYRLADAVISDAGSEIVAMLERLPDVVGAVPLSEWMCAAGLEVTQSDGHLLGVLRPRQPVSRAMVLGLHHDPVTHSLDYDGKWSCALGIAIAQHFKQQNIQLSFELVVLVRLDERLAGRIRPVGAAGVRQAVGIDHPPIRTLLASARVPADARVLSLGESDATTADQVTPARAEREAHLLQNFLQQAVF